MSLTVEIRIENKEWADVLPDVEKIIKKAAEAAWAKGNSAEFTLPVTDVEISVLLTDDATIQSLNRTYRNIDKPTNVLSFATLDDEDEPISEPFLAGDIIIAYETTAKEAQESKKALANHVFHLTVHGVLHLIGYDHTEENEAQKMEAMEIDILAAEGIENPY